MKKKLLALVCCLLLLFTSIARAEDEYQNHSVEILAFLSGGTSIQEWVNDELTADAGNSADFCVLSLNRLGMEYDASRYVQALKTALEEGSIKNAVTRMRACLALVSCGGMNLLPEGIADESIGQLGVMSYAFGLQLLNCGVPSQKWTVDSVLDELLSLQKEDGGWAVNGQYSDPDVTAMCLQAIAGYNGEADVSPAVERALSALSAMQLDNGGFKSYGKENMESAAQVVQALVALGINPLSDGRFIKNGSSAVDAMLAFRLPSGGYSHLSGGDENRMASLQALSCFAVLQAGRSVYDLKAVETVEYRPPLSWKHWALIGVAAFALAGSLLSLIKKNGRLKRVVSVLAIAAIAASAVAYINIESAADYYTAAPVTEVAGHVHLTIRCDNVAGLTENGSTPEDGVILPRTEFAYQEGDTVFDVLTRAVREHGIRMEHEGGSAAYINGINYLYELNYGSLSGWMFSVNGDFPSLGCNSYVVSDGDEIHWLYTTELGEDLK